MKTYHAAVGTESQKYVATIFEVYAEVQRLRDNLREQHRIWIDFYASVFKVNRSNNASMHTVYDEVHMVSPS